MTFLTIASFTNVLIFRVSHYFSSRFSFVKSDDAEESNVNSTARETKTGEIEASSPCVPKIHYILRQGRAQQVTVTSQNGSPFNLKPQKLLKLKITARTAISGRS